ncbi:DMT family transporter [Albimonas pacifica]|uniref:Permease of the drug/metabolite transporter (DMT) superfamily n=1 Tax=Albimonas pacifica TaxID=1114924 RepID=A0A1I3D0S7_9RHOB|nr:DMT family transporter [Albimonas pacifica]SFH80236.1 Permease of the drug/metabolite transporter (DMT) superfamily [Albimonas pacifica]
MRATAVGAVAVLLWALLALLTVRSGAVPPFQLVAMCLGIGALVGVVWAKAAGRPALAALRQPWPVAALGIGGIFGYHFFYFTALRNAPAAEAGLIAYLWPLLIVLFSGLLPGERLRALHLVGALAALVGAGLILAPGGRLVFAGEHALGFAAAGLCSLLWSGYSVLSRLAGKAPTEAVTGFCAAGAVLSAAAHLALETTVWPATTGEWLAVLALGAGPLGLAFYVWDVGVKRGDIQLLGVAAYAAPLLSTLALAAAGEAALTPGLALSAGLIAGGAGLAALGSARGRRAAPVEPPEQPLDPAP